MPVLERHGVSLDGNRPACQPRLSGAGLALPSAGHTGTRNARSRRRGTRLPASYCLFEGCVRINTSKGSQPRDRGVVRHRGRAQVMPPPAEVLPAMRLEVSRLGAIRAFGDITPSRSNEAITLRCSFSSAPRPRPHPAPPPPPARASRRLGDVLVVRRREGPARQEERGRDARGGPAWPTPRCH